MQKFTRETETDDADVSGGEPADPILTILQLPSGPEYPLTQFRKRIVIGADADCHIVVKGDKKVSGMHCLIYRVQNRLFIEDSNSKNKTRVTGLTMNNRMGEIHAGSVIKVGDTEFLACGRAGKAQKRILEAEDPGEYLHGAARVYGSQRKAAKAYKMSHSTFADWLVKRFKRE